MSASNAVEKHLLSSERRKIEGKWYWKMDFYYPFDGVVKTIMAPEEPTVTWLDLPRENALQQQRR